MEQTVGEYLSIKVVESAQTKQDGNFRDTVAPFIGHFIGSFKFTLILMAAFG